MVSERGHFLRVFRARHMRPKLRRHTRTDIAHSCTQLYHTLPLEVVWWQLLLEELNEHHRGIPQDSPALFFRDHHKITQLHLLLSLCLDALDPLLLEARIHLHLELVLVQRHVLVLPVLLFLVLLGHSRQSFLRCASLQWCIQPSFLCVSLAPAAH